jgi:hypothetical protein
MVCVNRKEKDNVIIFVRVFLDIIRFWIMRCCSRRFQNK